MINELWNSADLSGTRRLYHVVNKTDYVVGVCLEPPKYNHTCSDIPRKHVTTAAIATLHIHSSTVITREGSTSELIRLDKVLCFEPYMYLPSDGFYSTDSQSHSLT